MELGSYFLFLQEQIKDMIIISKALQSVLQHWLWKFLKGKNQGFRSSPQSVGRVCCSHAKEEGSSNIARPPTVTLASGDSFEFIQ
jgi:hypothetical protein